MDNIRTCVEMVWRGLGWSLIPEIALEGFDGCSTPCIFHNGEHLDRRTHVLCQNSALDLPQVDAFLRILRAM